MRRLSLLIFASLLFSFPAFAEEIYRPGFENPHSTYVVLPTLGGFLVGGSRGSKPSLSFFDDKGDLEWHKTYKDLPKGWIISVHPLTAPGTYLVVGEAGSDVDRRYVWSTVVDDQGKEKEIKNYVTLSQKYYAMTVYAVHPSPDGKSFWISGTTAKKYQGQQSATILKVDESGNILRSSDYGAANAGFGAVAAKEDSRFVYSLLNGWPVDPSVGHHLEKFPGQRKCYVMRESKATGKVEATSFTVNPSARLHVGLPREGGWDVVLKYMSESKKLIAKLLKVEDDGTRTASKIFFSGNVDNYLVVNSMFHAKGGDISLAGYLTADSAWGYRTDSELSLKWEKQFAVRGLVSFAGAPMRAGGTVYAGSTASGDVALIKVNKDGVKQ